MNVNGRNCCKFLTSKHTMAKCDRKLISTIYFDFSSFNYYPSENNILSRRDYPQKYVVVVVAVVKT